ncbi:DUF6346 domain-containing protein [Saccharopolyspora sp. K220]|uniref:DUF6346 domain-containing protein n=1 Tax=Saccharopolyspora soli TaxID=2926618 RepID=UPI001F55AF28|nr:DUF6346 domain-containing protein [Saccharopolyspora soli]MCI2418639.1 DUF6346 domain-containing protein [Saccharopolyspora soli]
MTPASIPRRAVRIGAHVLVRVLVALVLLTVLGATGMTATDGAATKHGTATATSCARVGPVSTSGLGFWWSCDAVVSWSDGSETRWHFSNSALTPDEPRKPVVRRESDRGSDVVVAEPTPYAALGWALLLPLLGLAFLGVRIPPSIPEQRSLLPVLGAGWWLVIAGGIGHSARPTLGLLLIIAGHVVLVVAAVLTVGRRRNGYPPREAPVKFAQRARYSWTLLLAGCCGIALALLFSPTWTGIMTLVALPVVSLGAGIWLWSLMIRQGTQRPGTAAAK